MGTGECAGRRSEVPPACPPTRLLCLLHVQIPPATTVGHRAETWNVNQWFVEVAVRVVSADEQCAVRLEDLKTGGPACCTRAAADQHKGQGAHACQRC